jgi:hypothetical protein
MSDAKGALVLIDALPAAKAVLGNRGYDADWLREAPEDEGIAGCIPALGRRKIVACHGGNSTSNVIETRTFSAAEKTGDPSSPITLRTGGTSSPPLRLYDHHVLVVSPQPKKPHRVAEDQKQLELSGLSADD